MNCCFASINTKGFQSVLDTGSIPQPDHITYEGAFNELTFTIGKKAKKSMQLHIGYSKCQNSNSSFDSKAHDYLAIFTKGSKDGQDRDNRVLNSVICLDISGSMNSGLTRNGEGHRLALAKQAIKMFFSKLGPNDAFGLVVFDDRAQTLINCQPKSQLNTEAVFATLDEIHTRGGTTLSTGFQESRKILVNYIHQQNYSKGDSAAQNRIVMLTDVGDNSMQNQKKFVYKVAHSQNIHTTIIGISDDFVSSTCESMNQIEGFNYMCATQVSDLKKYLFQNFNFTFFPANYDIQISLVENHNIQSIQVFGTVDAKNVKKYNNNFEKFNESIIITKTKTSFPSEIQLTQQGILKQYGGLIIVKLNLSSAESNKFETRIKLSYKTPSGKKQEQVYPVSFEVPGNQQFYSEQSLAEAMPAFFYVHEVKNILEKLELHENKNKETKLKYAQNLQKLKSLCPKSKLKELEDMIKVLKENNQEGKHFMMM